MAARLMQRCAMPTLRAAMPRAMVSPLASGGGAVAARTAMTTAWRPHQPRIVAAALNAMSRDRHATLAAPAPKLTQARPMSSWRLRPYAAAGTMAALPLSSLSAGFSKVSLSLLVLPWKALPTALCIAPVAAALPAASRMIFQNSLRHTTASVFTVILYLVLSFMPVPCFENLFSDLFFYGIALVSTFFMYTFFPEVLLHDFMFMHYLALFTIPLIPLAFAYMPMFAARAYLFL
eukprot:CAMPEP_0176198198 /NCGR_PEP_ID=MMETSP0121_2-20121125/7931_1 /TAXON_ID=160619 /ORGANISM="Kryptoperidinium foliaceum, Strain CCMP 1326" /LENGTH=233 /DNA_ID=CAMNT_0017537045 /DNA_START=78 /DNA_END=779 /DNA_ORIENTATION=-